MKMPWSQMSSRIPAKDRVPFWQKIAFAAGKVMHQVPGGLMFGALWMPVFNIGFGISPVVLGGIVMVIRAWDAMTDPVFGNLSDNTRTRWGRRRPYLFLGAIATAGVFPLFYNPPKSVMEGRSWLTTLGAWIPGAGMDGSNSGLVAYLLVIGLLFFTCFTVWSVPFYSLLLELTPNYDERTRTAAWLTVFAKLAAFVSSWIMLLVLTVGALAIGDMSVLEGKAQVVQETMRWLQPWLAGWSGGQAGEEPLVAGMRLVCWVVAGIMLIFGLCPAIFVRERYYEAEASKQARDPFWKSLGESIHCKPLWGLILVDFFLLIGNASDSALATYLNFYYVFGGDLTAAALVGGLKGSVLVVSGLALIPVCTWLAEKYEKKKVLLGMLGFSIFGHWLNYFLMTPENPYLQIIPAIFESAAISSVFLILPSMKADVADWDELETKRRREGSLNAFFSWFVKAAITIGMGLSGVLLAVSGFDAVLEKQPVEVLDRMFAIYIWMPIAMWGVAVVAAWMYPLSRKRCGEIRAALEARRGAI